MTAPNVYHYHPETKEYTGFSKAKVDPMLTQRAAELYEEQLAQAEGGEDIEPAQIHYRLPRNATFIAPTQPPEGFIRVFENDEWVTYEDHRGEIYYNDAREPVTIDFIGQVGDLTEEPRPLNDEEKWQALREERNMLLEETDKYVLPDYPISQQDKAAIYQYRKKLRDFTDDYETPDAVIIPEKPVVQKIHGGN